MSTTEAATFKFKLLLPEGGVSTATEVVASTPIAISSNYRSVLDRRYPLTITGHSKEAEELRKAVHRHRQAVLWTLTLQETTESGGTKRSKQPFLLGSEARGLELKLSGIKSSPSWNEIESPFMAVVRPLLSHQETLIKGWEQVNQVATDWGKIQSGECGHRQQRRETARLKAKYKDMISEDSDHVEQGRLFLARYSLWYSNFMYSVGKELEKVSTSQLSQLRLWEDTITKTGPSNVKVLLSDRSLISLSLQGMRHRQGELDMAALGALTDGLLKLLTCYEDHRNAGDKWSGLTSSVVSFEKLRNSYARKHDDSQAQRTKMENAMRELRERTDQSEETVNDRNYFDMLPQAMAISFGFDSHEDYVRHSERIERKKARATGKKNRRKLNKHARESEALTAFSTSANTEDKALNNRSKGSAPEEQAEEETDSDSGLHSESDDHVPSLRDILLNTTSVDELDEDELANFIRVSNRRAFATGQGKSRPSPGSYTRCGKTIRELLALYESRAEAVGQDAAQSTYFNTTKGGIGRVGEKHWHKYEGANLPKPGELEASEGIHSQEGEVI